MNKKIVDIFCNVKGINTFLSINDGKCTSSSVFRTFRARNSDGYGSLSQVVALFNLLQERKFLVRKVNAKRRVEKILHLTPKGRKLFIEVSKMNELIETLERQS